MTLEPLIFPGRCSEGENSHAVVQTAGKTTIIRSLATLCDAPLVEIPLTAGTDTSELLGGFEQLDLNRRLQLCKSKVEAVVQQAIKALILEVEGGETASERMQITMQWIDDLGSYWRTCSDSSDTIGECRTFRLSKLDTPKLPPIS